MVFGSVAYLNKKCRRVGGEDEDMDKRLHSESSCFAVRMRLFAGPQCCVKSVFTSCRSQDTHIFFVYNMGHCMAYDRIGGW